VANLLFVLIVIVMLFWTRINILALKHPFFLSIVTTVSAILHLKPSAVEDEPPDMTTVHSLDGILLTDWWRNAENDDKAMIKRAIHTISSITNQAKQVEMTQLNLQFYNSTDTER